METLLHRTGRNERILVAGRDGCGKTKGYWDIAEWLHTTGSPSQVFVLDPDYKARFDPRYPLPNVHIFDELETWQDYKAAVIKVRGEGVRERDDWLVCEMMNRVWSAAQAGHAELVWGKEMDDVMVEWRKKGLEEGDKGGSAFSSGFGADWQVINRLYDTFMYNLTRFPGNIYMTSALDTVTADEKDAETIRRYSKWGVKPAGQKRLGHVPADLLWFKETVNGWDMTQMRGTGRDAFKNEKLEDFVMGYLIPKAKWEL